MRPGEKCARLGGGNTDLRDAVHHLQRKAGEAALDGGQIALTLDLHIAASCNDEKGDGCERDSHKREMDAVVKKNAKADQRKNSGEQRGDDRAGKHLAHGLHTKPARGEVASRKVAEEGRRQIEKPAPERSLNAGVHLSFEAQQNGASRKVEKRRADSYKDEQKRDEVEFTSPRAGNNAIEDVARHHGECHCQNSGGEARQQHSTKLRTTAFDGEREQRLGVDAALGKRTVEEGRKRFERGGHFCINTHFQGRRRVASRCRIEDAIAFAVIEQRNRRLVFNSLAQKRPVLAVPPVIRKEHPPVANSRGARDGRNRVFCAGYFAGGWCFEIHAQGVADAVAAGKPGIVAVRVSAVVAR